jgi:hypothetical protein
MPPLRRLPLLALALLLWVGAPDDQALAEDINLPHWQLGLFVATYSGPSHEDLLTHINEYMDLYGDNEGRFDDFAVGTPVALRLAWNQQPRITYTLTYYFSSYNTSADFVFNGWPSQRSVDTNLHEIALALNYGLNFMRSDRISPYLGLGLDIFFADSMLNIDLKNPLPGGEDPLPDQYFSIPSRDAALGALAFAGLTYHFSHRIALQAEMQGVMGQVRQTFDYEGSFQHTNPSGEVPPNLDNDILLGAYQLNLNGLRLSLGLLFGF